MTKAKTIKIDNKEYELDSLSDVARQQLNNLRIVDQEINRLQTQLSIAQTKTKGQKQKDTHFV